MKRKKRQPTKAELEAEASYAKMMARWDKAPRFSRTNTLVVGSPSSWLPDLSAPPGRPTHQDLPSLSTPGGEASMRVGPTYTGKSVLGIATLHKSISQPVFSQAEAIEAATMRRN